MWVAFSNFTNKVNVVTADPKQRALLDEGTQTIIEVDEVENASNTVNTPKGPMLLLEALTMQPGSFSLVGGVMSHDDTWQEETL